MKIELGVVVFIALKEEFDYIYKSLSLRPSNDISSDFGDWYEWIIEVPNTSYMKVYFSFIGEMGPNAAIKYTTRFLEHYRPKIIVNIGLSGSLSKDVNLGDVVVPSLTDLYEDSSAMTEKDGVLSLEPSGRPVYTNSYKRKVDNFEYRKQDNYSRWVASCQEGRDNLVSSIESIEVKRLLGDPIKVRTGHTACGNVVVKSEQWKKILLKKDRKYLAVDMESAAIAYASIDESADTTGNLLVVRGISDKADRMKEIIDSVGDDKKEGIRRWAILNCLYFLREFLPTVISVDNTRIEEDTLYGRSSIVGKMPLSALVPEVIRVYERKGVDSIELYNSFFNFFTENSENISLFEYIVRQVESKEQSPNSIASIVGYTGTGKSAILSCLYLYQLDRVRSNLSDFIPIYLNLRSFLIEYADTEKGFDTAFDQELRELLQSANVTSNKKIMFIIDGFDEYQRHPHQSHIDQKLYKNLYDLSNRNNIIKVVGVGASEDSFIKERKSDMLSWASKEVLINLRRYPTDADNLFDVLQAYAKLENENDVDNICEQLKILITNYRIAEIDVFILSVLEMAVRQKWDSRDRGIGSLYLMFCRERIRFYAKNKTLSNDDCDKEIRRLSQWVFNYYMHRSKKVPDPIFINFAHEHTSIKEFLIAEHLIQCIIQQRIDDNDLLEFIYPYGINRFVKSTINRNIDIQRTVFKSIQDLYTKTNSRQKVHLCYMAGRFTDRNIRTESIGILRGWLDKLQIDPRNKKDINDQEFREWLLQQRTIYISLIYMDDISSSHDYIKLLLNNSQWDALNRGFHLEYYEDFQTTPSQFRMISFDDIKVRPKKTFEILYSKLEKEYESLKSEARSLVELHTLCSLCVHRHIAGKLVENKRKRLYALLKGALVYSKFNIPSFYRSYLEMSLNIIDREEVSPGSLMSEIYFLKTMPRAGWNAKRELNGISVMRRCLRPESVAEHIFGCLLLADAFLPEIMRDKSYSKNEILRTLLIHDLAEAYEGDKASFDKTEKDIQNEDRTMKRMSAIGGLDVFPGIKAWRDRWNIFKNQSSINGRIAKDIDLIECYVQLVNYYECDDCSIPDAEQWVYEDIYKELSTEIGKQIFEKLRHQDAHILSWFRKS